MRADRLIQILMLLQNTKKLTTQELAADLGVTPRTIQRDMDALSFIGIPVVAERGRGGGWKLIDDFRHRLSGMKLTDIQMLFVSSAEEMLEELGLSSGAIDVRQKLLATMPSAYQKPAKAAWERIYIDTDTWRQSREKVDSLHLILESVMENRSIEIEYRKSDGSLRIRLVHPLGLVAKSSHWYLVAEEDQHIKSYRISRIEKLNILEKTFQRPLDFDLRHYWKQSKQSFIARLPSYRVEGKIATDQIKQLTNQLYFGRIEEIGELSSDGMTPVILQFQGLEEAIRFVLSFGEHIKILSPKELIPEVMKRAEALICFQQKNHPATEI